MTKLLDSDTCIDVMQGLSPALLGRFEDELVQGGALALSAVALHELWFGVEASPRPDFHAARLRMLLDQNIAVYDFDSEAAQTAARIRAELRRQGTMIGALDILIAGHALSQGWTVVTGNLKDFSRVPGLKVENWAEPQSE